MAKIRGVKPEFWTDEDVVSLSIPARLLFIGMWNFACDNGHLADKSKQLKMRIMPADDVNVAELLRELDEASRIERANGVITIHGFVRHQKVDKRWFTTCQVPGCEKPKDDPEHAPRSGHAGATSGPRREPKVATLRPLGDVDVDVDVDGDGERKKPGRKRPAHAIADTWRPSDSHRATAAARNVDLDVEATAFRNHAIANDRRLVNWDAGFTNWLAKAYPKPAAAKPRNPNIPEGW